MYHHGSQFQDEEAKTEKDALIVYIKTCEFSSEASDFKDKLQLTTNVSSR